MIDVRANIGAYSLSLKDQIGNAILFEPITKTCKKLRQNVELNGLNYEIYNVALGNFSGEVFLEYSRNKSAKVKEGSYDNKSSIRAKIKKLDEFMSDSMIHEIEFVKIDVEGYELEVLKGAEKLFESKSLRIIQFERLRRTPLQPLIAFFEKRHWRVFGLDANGQPTFASDVIESSHDLFAVRQH